MYITNVKLPKDGAGHVCYRHVLFVLWVAAGDLSPNRNVTPEWAFTYYIAVSRDIDVRACHGQAVGERCRTLKRRRIGMRGGLMRKGEGVSPD